MVEEIGVALLEYLLLGVRLLHLGRLCSFLAVGQERSLDGFLPRQSAAILLGVEPELQWGACIGGYLWVVGYALLGVVVIDAAISEGFSQRLHLGDGLAPAVIVSILWNFLENHPRGNPTPGLPGGVADVLLLLGEGVSAEGEGQCGLWPDGVVTGDALWQVAWLGCAEEDMSGSVVLVVIGSEFGVGRLGC